MVLNGIPIFNSDVETFKPHFSFVDVGHKFQFNENWNLGTNLAFSSLNSSYITSNNIKTEDWFYENILVGQLTDKLNFTGEFNINYWSGEEYVTNINYELIHFGSFLQTEYNFNDNHKVVIGAQFNRPEDNEWDISPRVALISHLDDNWSTKLMYGQAFRQPYPAELFLNIPMTVFGNPNLKPQKTSTAEAQLTYRNRKIEANLGLFKSLLEDTIEINPATQKYRNGENVESYGIEFDARYKLTKAIGLDISFLSQANENDAGVKDRYGTPNVMLKTGVNYSLHNGVAVGVFNTYMGESTNNPNAQKVNPAPNSVNLLSANLDIDLPRFFAMKQIAESSFSLYFNNILDEDHITYSTVSTINTNHIQSGRAIYGKIKVRF